MGTEVGIASVAVMIVQAILAVGICFAAGLAFRPALQWSPWPRMLMWLVLSAITALMPCIVPLTAKSIRLLVALVAIALLTKLYDLLRQASLARALTLSAYVSYLTNWFWLVLSKAPPPVAPANDRARLKWPAALSIFFAFLSIQVFSAVKPPLDFDSEHVVKVAVIVTTIVCISNCGAIVWRLSGGVAWDPMLNPIFARTPADFWRRWNRPAQQFLHEYAYLPAGGLKHHARATLVTFIVSGLLHEYVFDIAAGHIQGWQLLFFTIQGFATLATMRLHPRGTLVLPCLVGTLMFNLLTATLFFASVNQIVPFYAAGLATQ